MGRDTIKPGELALGKTLEWHVFDDRGRLLLREGAVIASPRQLDALRMRELYRDEDPIAPEVAAAQSAAAAVDAASPFERLDGLIRRMEQLFDDLLAGAPNSHQTARELAADLRRLYSEQADAMLGAVHLTHEYDYTLCHPIHAAILCAMMAKVLGYDAARTDSLIAAALTQNAAMIELQQTLETQSAPLTPQQRAALREHPRRAVELLQAVGVDDELWLNAVLQHHERIDGSGYPDGLRDEQMLEPARLLALGDSYSALISARAYRDGMQAKQALRDLYLSMDKECGKELTQIFIREIGVYPPGSFVTLFNGEVGIVTHRGSAALTPIVASYIGPRGAPLPRPLRRDTSTRSFRIQGNCEPDTSVPVNLNRIWAS